MLVSTEKWLQLSTFTLFIIMFLEIDITRVDISPTACQHAYAKSSKGQT